MVENSHKPKVKSGFQSPVEALFGEDFNLGLFIHIARRNLIWLVLFSVTAFSVITLFLRYQVPQHQATSTLLLKSNRSPNLIDIEDLLESNTEQAIEQEIEIIKSSRFLIEALKNVPLDYSMYSQGNVLSRELYKSEPFLVKATLLDSTFVNQNVSLRVVDGTYYQLDYTHLGQPVSLKLPFGRWCNSPAFNIQLDRKTMSVEDMKLMNLYFVFHDPEMIRRHIASRVTIGLVNFNASKMAVSFRDPSEQKSVDIVNAVSKAIIDYEYEVKSESAKRVIGFLDAQIDTLRKELLDSENELRKFKEENKLIDPVSEQEYLRGQYIDLEARTLELALEETTLDWLQTYVDDTVNNIATILPPSSELIDFSPYVNTLTELSEQRRNLLASVKSDDIRVRVLDEQIIQVKSDFREGLSNAREKLKINKDYLIGQIAANDQQFGLLPIKEAEFVRLIRLNEIREKFYLLLLERRAEFEIAKAGLVSDYVLLEKARDANPVTIEKSYLQLAGVVFGVFLGLSLIVARYLFHNTITSLRDLEKYCTADLLGVVPRHPDALRSLALVITNNPKSLISEAFRSLRTNIEFMVSQKDSPIIAVTSTVSGEGKTFIIANLGMVLTLLGKKVVLVDFDMRKPKLHRAFKTDNDKGSSTILIGKDTIDACIVKTEHSNLDVITSGPIPPNPSELLASENSNRLFEDLQARYDMILVDTPPIGLVADALEILTKADVPIYTIRANFSNRSFIKNINTLVEDKSMDNLRIILNDAGVGGGYGSGGYGLGYGYGYGYGYGSYYRYPYSGYGYGYYSDSPKKAKWYRRLLGGSEYE